MFKKHFRFNFFLLCACMELSNTYAMLPGEAAMEGIKTPKTSRSLRQEEDQNKPKGQRTQPHKASVSLWTVQELHCHILNFLPSHDLWQTRLVSKNWRMASNSCITILDLSPQWWVSPEDKSTYLTYLASPFPSHIPTVYDTTSLFCSNAFSFFENNLFWQPNRGGVTFVCNTPSKDLWTSRTLVFGESNKYKVPNPLLKKTFTHITMKLEEFPHLTSLDLSNNTAMTDEALKGAPHLAHLILKDNERITVHGLSHLTNLTTLDIRGAQVGEKILTLLPLHKSLQKLIIDDYEPLTEADIEDLLTPEDTSME